MPGAGEGVFQEEEIERGIEGIDMIEGIEIIDIYR
jgi:hypothetical protein